MFETNAIPRVGARAREPARVWSKGRARTCVSTQPRFSLQRQGRGTNDDTDVPLMHLLKLITLCGRFLRCGNWPGFAVIHMHCNRSLCALPAGEPRRPGLPQRGPGLLQMLDGAAEPLRPHSRAGGGRGGAGQGGGGQQGAAAGARQAGGQGRAGGGGGGGRGEGGGRCGGRGGERSWRGDGVREGGWIAVQYSVGRGLAWNTCAFVFQLRGLLPLLGFWDFGKLLLLSCSDEGLQLVLLQRLAFRQCAAAGASMLLRNGMPKGPTVYSRLALPGTTVAMWAQTKCQRERRSSRAFPHPMHSRLYLSWS